MAQPILLPKQGNSVESCIIQRWAKNVGDTVKEGETLCEVETDKATVEVPSSASGTILAIFRPAGDDVPVQTVICAVGSPGEDVAALAPAGAAAPAPVAAAAPAASAPAPTASAPAPVASAEAAGSSPRARAAATAAGLPIANIPATGPNGLVIERDVQAVVSGQATLTPAAKAAKAAAAATGGAIPATGSGLGGRVVAADIGKAAPAAAAPAPVIAAAGSVTETPVKGIRKIIADRMRASLGGTAQLTLTASAKAVAMQAWRAKAKTQAEAMGLPPVSINDLILFAVSRVLPRFPALNAHFLGDKIRQFADVNLGVAVDTDKGLMVPVLAQANRKTLAQIAAEFKPLAKACQAGKATPDQLTGGTFTITNLGALGIESFTPVLNAPEVAILGVGGISLKPYESGEGVEFLPAITLSLTIDHQALDGAPAARFLQALCVAIENIDLTLAQ